jgi:Na+-driven multidrug efflux pump
VSALAAHTIVLNMIALWFQVPLGIHFAAAVRVGTFLRAIARARLAGQVSLGSARASCWIAPRFIVSARAPRLFTAITGVVATPR